MKTQLQGIGLVLGLAVVAGVAFLIGQMSTVNSVNAQTSAFCWATHTGIWQGSQLALWNANTPAVATISSSTRAGVALNGDMSTGLTTTAIGRRIKIEFVNRDDSGTYTITTAVPCQ